MDLTKVKEPIKDICVSVFIFIIIIIRMKATEDSVIWIGNVSYIGFVVALGDLFFDVLKLYNKKKVVGFVIFSVIIGLGCLIFLALFLTGEMQVSNKMNDMFTLLALFVSLPNRLYLQLIKKMLPNKETNT